LANHKSALKRARQNEVIKVRNMAYKTRVKSAVKTVRLSADEGSAEKAAEELKKAASTIQKSASKGVIPKKRAARKISRLALQVNRISK